MQIPESTLGGSRKLYLSALSISCFKMLRKSIGGSGFLSNLAIGAEFDILRPISKIKWKHIPCFTCCSLGTQFKIPVRFFHTVFASESRDFILFFYSLTLYSNLSFSRSNTTVHVLCHCSRDRWETRDYLLDLWLATNHKITVSEISRTPCCHATEDVAPKDNERKRPKRYVWREIPYM